PKKRRKPCLIWPPEKHHRLLPQPSRSCPSRCWKSHRFQKRLSCQNRLSIQTRNGAFDLSTLQKNWNMHSIIRGRNGRYSSIPHSESWWKGTTTVRHGLLDRRGEGRKMLRGLA